MRFLSIFTPDPATARVPPSAEEMAEMRGFIEGMENSGVLLANGALQPDSMGLRIRSAGEAFIVIDGGSAFKPGVAGFAVLEEKSREDAIENGKRFLRVMGGGECEMPPADGRAAQGVIGITPNADRLRYP